MCDPDSGDFRGAVQLIMSNVGHTPSVVIENVKSTDSKSQNGSKKIQPS